MAKTPSPQNNDVRTLLIVISAFVIYTACSALLAHVLSDMVLPWMAAGADLIMALAIIIAAAKRKYAENQRERLRRIQRLAKIHAAD